jgi:protease-4
MVLVRLTADLIVNAARAVRNLLARLAAAPDYVVLVAAGSLPERRPAPRGRLARLIPRLLRPAAEESLEEWRERLDLLAGERRVRGVVLKVGELRAGTAALEGLRAALDAFRARGKRLIAYLTTADLAAYYLASSADQVVLPEAAELALHGPRAEVTFLRRALDRLGIAPAYHHIAEYKTAAHRFLYPAMTEPQRRMVQELVDGQYEEMVTAIGRSRAVSAAQVRSAVDAGLIGGLQAKARGLADTLAFEDELPALLGAAEAPAVVLPWELARHRLQVPYRRTAPRCHAIGVVQLIGAIVPGESRDLPVPLPLLGQHLAGHETVVRALRTAARRPEVRAVVFHVDSGGGSAVASEMIWREVARLRARKPVVVAMGNVAGSGGYYVACGANHIVAGATTITGSIGVVAGKLNLRGLFERAGLRREIVSRGETAAMFSAFTDFTEREWEILKGWMEEIYARFIGRVAEGRRKDPPTIQRLAGGRVYTGREALALGLIDEVGTVDTAVRKAKALAGIPEEAETPVVTIRPPRAAGIPGPPEGSWVDALEAAARLLAEPALLLTVR